MANTTPILAQVSGAGTAAALDTGTDPGDLPTNGDLPSFGTAAALDTGTASDEVPTNGDLPLTKSFTSSGQTITSGGTLSLAHGLGAVPALVQLRLVCTDAGGEAGYAQNDEAIYAFGDGGSSSARGVAVTVDSTNVVLRFSGQTNAFQVLNKSDGTAALLTNGKWDLVVRAWA